MPLTVPALHDDAIVLRPPEARDAAAITAAVQDPDIPRFTMVPSPYTIDDAAAFIERSGAWWHSGDAAPFVIVDATTGTLLGSVGVHDVGLESSSAHVGYWVAVEARGRGVATRALRLVARWALEDLGLPRVEVYVFVENERSQRVAGRGSRRVHPGGDPRLRRASDRSRRARRVLNGRRRLARRHHETLNRGGDVDAPLSLGEGGDHRVASDPAELRSARYGNDRRAGSAMSHGPTAAS